MDSTYEPEGLERDVRDLARAFAAEHIAPHAATWARDSHFPREEMLAYGKLGLMAVNVPRRWGGLEAGPLALALSVTEVARADAAFAVAVSVTNMVAELIDRFGTDDQQRSFLPRIASGEAVCASFALSEAESASDAGSLRTQARREGDWWILDGAKQWISHGAEAGLILVWARSERGSRGAHGISAFLVERGTPGLTAGPPEDKMGLRASHTVPLLFERCAIPADHLLGTEGGGFKLAMAALDGGRIGIAAQASGVGRAVLEEARKAVAARAAKGAEGERQAEAFLLADLATRLRAAELLGLEAARLKQQRRPFKRQASMAKLFASETVQHVCAGALEILGPEATIEPHPAQRCFRDARVQTLYEGTSEIQRWVIAREILG